MARKVTNEDIIRFNEIYAQCGTYAEVARQTGWSASTVRKYITPGQVLASAADIIRFDETLLVPFDPTLLVETREIGDLLVLTECEQEAIKELWKELRI